MRRLATFLVMTAVMASLVDAPATAAIAARCRLVAAVDGPTLTISYRLTRGGAREDWRVKFFRDGELAYRRVHTTDGNGRFRVVRTFDNERGRETILASAQRLDDGAVCRVSVRI